jgi:aspartate oxidase
LLVLVNLYCPLFTGAGLSSPAAVQVLVEEGTRQVQNLIKLGAQFE